MQIIRIPTPMPAVEPAAEEALNFYGKSPGLHVHSVSPLNVGTPTGWLRGSFLTPTTLFFMRNHGAIPQIDARDYTLDIDGLVDQPLHLTLDTLRERFNSHSITATLSCAGNRRDELNSYHPIPGEVMWSADAVGTAVWRGVSLGDVLRAAGIQPEGAHVAFEGLDDVEREGKTFSFGGSIPLDKALADEVLLAYDMNGVPLPPEHGYPLRVIVPGYIGARSVKWVRRIRVQAAPSTNYFQQKAYRLFAPEVRPETADWSQGEMLGQVCLNSVITGPSPHERVRAGRVLVRGIAFSGSGQPVERVEVSGDGGSSWEIARLDPNAHRWAWRFWHVWLPLNRGPQTLMVRASDGVSTEQPRSVGAVWNFKGYLNNAWHRVPVRVV